MRIHGDPEHQDWIPEARYARIFVDGVEHDNVIMADDEAGLILKCAKKDGRFLTDDMGNAVSETIYGKVQIKFDGDFFDQKYGCHIPKPHTQG